MKKFLFNLFILIVIAGAVFLLGWAQFRVPPGAYGIINSKTHGVDPVPVRSGEFRWLWYKLIPTNVNIAVFRLNPVRFNMNFNSSLPSGDSYAAFAGLSGTDFSWELTAAVSFSINPDKLVELAARQNLSNQQELDAYIQEAAQNIEVLIVRSLTSVDTDSERLEKILAGNPDEEMEREIAGRFPEITDFSFNLQSASFPDFVLYRYVRLLYEEFLAKQREVVSSSLGRRAESHIAAQLHFEELERYGELLTKYPVLLDYLALDNNSAEQ